MKPQTLDHLIKALSILGGLFVFLVFLGGCTGAYDITTTIEFLILCMVSLFILMMGFVYLLPVKCIRTDCIGWMKPGWKPEYADYQFIWRLFYICEGCGDIHYSSFSLSIGLGEPY